MRSNVGPHMRLALAAILALVTFFGIDYGLQRVGETLDVAAHVSYSPPLIRESYDQEYEVFGETTTFGYAVSAFSAVLATWLARATYFGSLWQRVFSPVGRRKRLAWLFCTASLLVVLSITSRIFGSLHFPYKGHVWLLVELATIGALIWISYRWAMRPLPVPRKE